MTYPAFIKRAAIALLILMMPLIGGQSALAQSVTNTAHAAWTVSGTPYEAVSNTVAFQVLQQAVTIKTFAIAPSGGQTLTFTPSTCGQSVVSTPTAALASQQSAAIVPANTLHSGDTFYFTLTYPQGNTDPNAIDRLDLAITASSGDRETIRVYETGPSTGVFAGAMPTAAVTPQAASGNCRLEVIAGDKLTITAMANGQTTPITQAQLQVLADPFGWVFDSEDGSAVNSAKVTLINAASGAPAVVFAPDGVTAWPSTVYTGQQVTDAAGRTYQLLPGQYRFPLALPGIYKVIVEPPAPYTAPSAFTQAQLAGFTRNDGAALILNAASYGGTFTLVGEAPVQTDIPVDRLPVSVALTKTASRQNAQPGNVVFYTVTARNPDPQHAKKAVTLVDMPSSLLRLRPETVKLDHVAAPSAVHIAADGNGLTVDFGTIAGGASRVVTYAMTIRANAPAGRAVNRAETTDSRGLKSFASALVNIEGDNLTGRMTIIGRITDHGCAWLAPHRGIPGVQVMLEDGSYAITDAEGRYHFDGVVPGTHVVAAIETTLPDRGKLLNCGRSMREAGSASSRFVRGQGGSLAVADFHAVLPESWTSQPGLIAGAAGAPYGPAGKPVKHTVEALMPGKGSTEIDEATYADRVSAGAETDWLSQGDGPPEFLFPTIDHNPRSPAVRVVIRHRVDQHVELFADGKPVEKFAFDGTKQSANGRWSVSIWRSIPLDPHTTHLSARVLNADGTLAVSLSRDVHFASTAAEVKLVPEKSRLIADGRSRPVLAVRMLDRLGKPVHAGISGDFSLNAPYESAQAQDMMQTRALSGLGRSAPHWTVTGDDGIALIELAPTMVSGALQLDFDFLDNKQKRHQSLNGWIVPGDVKWTLVGLAEGSIGARSVADAMERTGRFDSDLGNHVRTAFYAKGRVLGRHILTLAYDSAKQRDDTQLLGAIDPRAYYTVFADGSDRRFDAASRNKLYVRLESSTYYALFGDFSTGFNQTQLTRYQRTGTGLKGELHMGALHAQAFATRIATAHHHDEIQGAGISGPYQLSSRAIVANSESLVLEVRDRFRSEKIVTSRPLSRFVDYDIDLLAGTVTFKQPILSRDQDLNPQFVVIDYEVDTNAASGAINAGIRADFTTADGKMRVGATAVTDTGNGPRTQMGGLDLKAQIGRNTELRAEAAISRSTPAGTNTAWLVEAEHHDGRLDFLGYARSMDLGFGVGQSGGAESGRRKFGADARYLITDQLSMIASGWIDTSLTSSAKRTAVQLRGEYRTQKSDLHLGISRFDDQLIDGRSASSTVIEGGVSRRMLNNRLEVDAATSIALGSADSADLPSRSQFTLRYALSSRAKLTGTYEIANGGAVKARTARAGIELTPWQGARVTGGIGQQDIAEDGKRSFASFGLAQSYDVTPHLTLDGTFEANKLLGSGINPARIVNPAQPLSSGGQIGSGGTLTENFTAVTAGATWRANRWSLTMRGEYRDGESAERKGLTIGAIRQLGDGKMVGSGLTWTRAAGVDGTASEILTGAAAMALRPANSAFATLAKIELRSDKVVGATGGLTAAAGGTAITGAGNLQSTRIITSVSTNWSPRKRHRVDGQDDEFVQRTEVGLFGAVRYNLDRGQGLDLSGTSLFGGLDLRVGIGERFEIGGSATVRANLSDHSTSFAVGPEIGFVPTRDVLLTVGYNIVGYRDRDFSVARSTDKGLFATMRMKFDASSLAWLGLSR